MDEEQKVTDGPVPATDEVTEEEESGEEKEEEATDEAPKADEESM